MTTERPLYPCGPPPEPGSYSESARRERTSAIANAPSALHNVVDALAADQLEWRYRNWTVRQIVHHIADSHVHSYIRFKWALTEENPLIKAYEEADWVCLADCIEGDIEPSLLLLTGLHAKWVQTLESMSADDFAKTFRHPQSGETVSLWEALSYYPWHSQHHTGQIAWLVSHAD